MNKKESPIWVYGDLDDDQIRGGKSWEALDPDLLKKNITEFSQAVLPALSPLRAISEDFNVAEVELSLAVSASGKVGFLGSGAEVGGSATIKIKLKVN